MFSHMKETCFLLCIIISVSINCTVGNVITNSYALIPCMDNSDCEIFGGICSKEYCKCNDSHLCKQEIRIITNKLYNDCTANSDCRNIFNSVCQNSKCVCDVGFIPSENERKCLKVSDGPGNECEESGQCYKKTPSTVCYENKCVCQEQMHEFEGSCYKNVGFGGQCRLSEECSQVRHSKCSQSRCQCVENYVSNGTECLLIASGINSSCTDNIQCEVQLSNGSECVNNICRCREFFHYKPTINRCTHDILLNEICTSHRDCHQPGTGPSRLACILGVCKCEPPYSKQDGFCVNSSNSIVLFKSLMLFLGTFLVAK